MNLTKGRKEPCKNNIGGVKKLYLATYVDYDVRSLVGYRDLLLTSFPTTQMYLFEGVDATFTETYNEDGYYSQEVNTKLIKQDLATAQLLTILMNNKVRAIITDELGNNKVVGLINGLDVDVSAQKGGSKVDFNGYDLKLSGQEEFKAPYVDNLENTGLTDKTLDFGCILASSDLPASLSNKVSDCNAVL